MQCAKSVLEWREEGISICRKSVKLHPLSDSDKGRSHQQSQAVPFYGDRIRANTAHPRRASEITDILEAVAAGRFREIAIAREVGDSVLYHALSE
jgi:hypothetical protein